MIYFEQLQKLKPGDTIYQHTAWNYTVPTAFVEWQVKAVHAQSVDIICPTARHLGDIRIMSNQSPLTHWSLSKLVQPAHITTIGKFNEEFYADPWCLIGEDFWASASDDPAHPQGVWEYEEVTDWDSWNTADMIPCFWDDLPLTLRKFLVDFFAPEDRERTDTPYTQPHYTIEVMVLEVNEWGDALDTCGQEGWRFVTTDLEEARKAARSLAYAVDDYAANIPAASIFPFAPNQKGR